MTSVALPFTCCYVQSPLQTPPSLHSNSHDNTAGSTSLEHLTASLRQTLLSILAGIIPAIMLPFTNSHEQRNRPSRPRDRSIASVSSHLLCLFCHYQRLTTSQSILLHQPQVPSRSPISRRRASSSSSCSSHVSRLLSREVRSTAIKKACKEDLNSLFANLNGATPLVPSPHHSSTQRQEYPRTNESTAEGPDPTSTSHTVNDTIWLECQATIEALEVTLNGTFTLASDDSNLDFGDHLRTANKAFADSKTTIRKASKCMNYHWYREFAKRPSMFDAQVVLGQRIRKAYDAAMERKEMVLDALMDRQVELRDQQMDALLAEVDPEWFNQEEEHMEDA